MSNVFGSNSIIKVTRLALVLDKKVLRMAINVKLNSSIRVVFAIVKGHRPLILHKAGTHKCRTFSSVFFPKRF